MILDGFYVKGIDLLTLFVSCFTFLIACFSEEYAIGYIIAVMLGALILSSFNYFEDKKKARLKDEKRD